MMNMGLWLVSAPAQVTADVRLLGDLHLQVLFCLNMPCLHGMRGYVYVLFMGLAAVIG